jgi:cell shape-determining protein MreD
LRIAAQVLLAYLLVLLLGALWQFLPLGRAIPDVVALVAAYLGLTARYRLAPAMAGAIVLGYLADLLVGSPRGLIALSAGLVCLGAHFVQGRLLVRGFLFTVIFSATTGLLAGLLVLTLRATAGLATAGLAAEVVVLALSALLTGVAGPAVFRLCRLVDARLARTQRERNLALEGVIP